MRTEVKEEDRLWWLILVGVLVGGAIVFLIVYYAYYYYKKQTVRTVTGTATVVPINSSSTDGVVGEPQSVPYYSSECVSSSPRLPPAGATTTTVYYSGSTTTSNSGHYVGDNGMPASYGQGSGVYQFDSGVIPPAAAPLYGQPSAYYTPVSIQPSGGNGGQLAARNPLRPPSPTASDCSLMEVNELPPAAK